MCAVGAVALLATTPIPVAQASTRPTPPPSRPERLLDHAMRLDEAMKKAPKDEISTRNRGASSAELTDLAGDPTVWVDAEGRIFYADTLDTEPAAGSTRDASVAQVGAAGIGDTTPYPLADTFLLESRPGANTTIFLDFDGATVTDTGWNSSWSDGAPIVVGPADDDGNPATFSPFERAAVQHIWQEVAEDFAPFNVNVTTKDPGRDRIERTTEADQQYGIWVIITARPAVAQCGCAGIAYLNSFDAVDPTMSTKPTWAFTDLSGSTGNVASHEIGHTLSLHHDGTSTEEYYWGQGNWGPIMGGSGGKPLTQWSKGEYADANRTENDLANIAAHGPGYAADDHGDTAVTATALGSAPLSTTGLIGSPTDIDVFSFTWAGGAFTATASPSTTSPNLDIRLSLRNAAGTSTIASADPASGATGYSWYDATGLGATVSTSLPAGTYTLWVEGVGFGDPLTTGYTDYGSVGRYRLASTGRSITVNRLGPGSGTVTSDLGGINCGATCTATFAGSTVVTLTATPAAGSAFGGWTGPCYGYDSCNVTVDAAKSVNATFDTGRSLSLTVTSPLGTYPGDATVSVRPQWDWCSALVPCAWTLPIGSGATLEADPTNLPFSGWSGACSGQSATCTVSMSQARSVVANFASSGKLLTVDSDNTGTVTVAPYGLECYSTGCTYAFTTGATATLTAEPYSYGYRFDHWSGACSGTTPTCVVTMTTAKTATAVFTRGSVLSVSRSYSSGAKGSVTSTPAGIDCGITCTGTFATGTTVTLTATPVPGSNFTGWFGACSGTGTCTVVMGSDEWVEARFTGAVNQLVVSLAGAGTGTVTSSPAGVYCQTYDVTCAEYFAAVSEVTLTATPDPGSAFTGWSGACSGTGTCKVTMSAARSVTATFGIATYALAVSRSGTGTGTVTSSPAGINCGSTCSASYSYGTPVVLTASPGANSEFTGWSGACSGTGRCSVTMTAAKSVAATFSPVPDTFRPFASPIRLVDTRPTGVGILEPPYESTPLAASTTRRYAVGSALSIPAGAAVALNVIAVLPAANGNLAVYPCTSVSTPPPSATFLNYQRGVTTSTAGLVELGATGDVCVRTPVRTDIVIDATGWFPSGNTFSGLAQPTRLFDTRSAQKGALEVVDITTPFTDGTVRRFTPLGGAGVPASGVSALYVTAVAILPSNTATLQVYPCTTVSDAPPTSVTVSYSYGSTVATASVVELSADGGFCVRSTGTTHLLLDVVGWFGTTGGHRTFAAPSLPTRLLDTRPGNTGLLESGTDTTTAVGVSSTVVTLAGLAGLPAAATLGAVSLTITAQAPAQRGWVKIWACTDAATPPPDATTINMAALVATGNQVFVGTSTNGKVCLSASSTVHVTIDAHAWFTR